MRYAKKENKNFSPEFRSYPTRVTKFQKKMQKFKKQNSGIIFIQTRFRQAEKEKKKILSQIPFLSDSGMNIPKKKIAKKFKKLKNIIPALFSFKPG